MKRTLTINLSQRIFNIDEDAYNMLNDYLNTLKHVFANNSSSDEIINDIESRISEIFDEKRSYSESVITIEDVTEVINRIGRPEDFSMCDDDNYADDGNTEVPPTPPSGGNKRKLFRDPDNKMVGGVCSGIATYINADPMWIRILLICLTFFVNILTVALYLILWIVIPEAKTPAERMAMEGQAPTLDNIAQTVTEQYNSAREYVNSPKTRSRLDKICNGIASAFAVLFKILLAVIALVAIPAVIACALGAGSIVVTFIQALTGSTVWLTNFDIFPHFMITGGSYIYVLLAYLGLALFIGVPLLAAIILVCNLIFSSLKPIGKTARTIMLVLWLLGIALIIAGIATTYASVILPDM